MTLYNPFTKNNPYYVPDNRFKHLQTYVNLFYKTNKQKHCEHCQKISNQKGLETRQNFNNHQVNLTKDNFRFKNQIINDNPFFRSNLIESKLMKAKKQNIQYNRKDDEFLKKLIEDNPFKNKNLDKGQIQFYSNSMFPSFAGCLQNKKKQLKCFTTNKTIPQSSQNTLQKIPFKAKLQNSCLQKQKPYFQTSKNINKMQAVQKISCQQAVYQQQDPKEIFIKGKTFYLNKVEKYIKIE